MAYQAPETNNNLKEREKVLWWMWSDELDLLQAQQDRLHTLLQLNKKRAANSRMPLEFVGGWEHFHPPHTPHNCATTADSYDKVTICTQNDTAPHPGSPVASRCVWVQTRWDADGLPSRVDMLQVSPSLQMLTPLGLRVVIQPCWGVGILPMNTPFRILRAGEPMCVCWQAGPGARACQQDFQSREVYALVKDRTKGSRIKSSLFRSIVEDVYGEGPVCHEDPVVKTPAEPLARKVDHCFSDDNAHGAVLLTGSGLDLSNPDSWEFPEGDDEDNSWGSDSDESNDDCVDVGQCTAFMLEC